MGVEVDESGEQPLRVSVPTGTIAGFRHIGETGGPTAVFLHGAGLNAHTWDVLLEHFSGEAIALDLPGHGDSSWRDDVDYSPATNAATIAAALDTMLTEPAVFVGHSLGGLTAIELARQRPDLVIAVVLVEALPFGPDDLAGIPVQARDFMDGPRDFPSLDAIVDRAISFGFGPSRDVIMRSVESNTRVRDDGRVEWKYHWASVDPTAVFRSDYRDLWDELPRVTVPVTLVSGEHGLVTPALLDELSRRAPDVAVLRLPTGHNVQEEAPAALAAIVTEVTDAAQARGSSRP
jgi:pimeloyl-ACP methyl ester carboxylesterase